MKSWTVEVHLKMDDHDPIRSIALDLRDEEGNVFGPDFIEESIGHLAKSVRSTIETKVRLGESRSW